MPPSFPIRVAGPSDAAEVTRLMCAFRDWWAFDAPSDDGMRAGVERLLGDPDTEFLLAGDPPAGVAQLRFRYGVWHSACDCLLEDLFVADDARRTGMGAGLIEAAVERARARGCARIELDVNEANAAALALYERMGFSASPEGSDARNLFMRRRIQEPT